MRALVAKARIAGPTADVLLLGTTAKEKTYLDNYMNKAIFIHKCLRGLAAADFFCRKQSVLINAGKFY
jgi:hypothetical protein